MSGMRKECSEVVSFFQNPTLSTRCLHHGEEVELCQLSFEERGGEVRRRTTREERAIHMTREEILREIEAYIAIIAKPLSRHEVANGWDADHQQKAIDMMRDIRQSLIKREGVPKWSIVRTMDSWGVDGELFDKACTISHHLNTMGR